MKGDRSIRPVLLADIVNTGYAGNAGSGRNFQRLAVESVDIIGAGITVDIHLRAADERNGCYGIESIGAGGSIAGFEPEGGAAFDLVQGIGTDTAGKVAGGFDYTVGDGVFHSTIQIFEIAVVDGSSSGNSAGIIFPTIDSAVLDGAIVEESGTVLFVKRKLAFVKGTVVLFNGMTYPCVTNDAADFVVNIFAREVSGGIHIAGRMSIARKIDLAVVMYNAIFRKINTGSQTIIVQLRYGSATVGAWPRKCCTPNGAVVCGMERERNGNGVKRCACVYNYIGRNSVAINAFIDAINVNRFTRCVECQSIGVMVVRPAVTFGIFCAIVGIFRIKIVTVCADPFQHHLFASAVVCKCPRRHKAQHHAQRQQKTDEPLFHYNDISFAF